MVEAEHEENPAQGKTHHAGNWDSEKQTQQKAHMAQSQIPEDLWLRSTSYNMQCQFNKDIKLELTTKNITSLDGHRNKDSEA
ncbi:hypothetical protein MG293_001160 [Ovis ammon polii]|uniref:Uncharacterized protein n=1 Tax=Ovis ammon polii TaxID=230172 RepID=A0AAD4YFD6_OVIAM|nr:hypothetical protein MG293_001160 [Ovis ammon polii]